MKTHIISDNTKKEFSCLITELGWREAISSVIERSKGSETRAIRNEISRRFTNWFGLKKQSTDCAIVIEDGLGASTISLSKICKTVYVIFLDIQTQSVVEAHLDYLNILNVMTVDSGNIKSISEVAVSPLIVVYNDDNNQKKSEITNDLVSIFSDYDIYYLCDNTKINETISIVGKGLNTYHYTGPSRSPFQIIPSVTKVKEIGKLKFLFKRLFPSVFSEFISITTLDINDSFFQSLVMKVATDLKMSSKKPFISKMIVSKPNGAILFLEVDDAEFIVRISFDELSDARLQASIDALNSINVLSHSVAPNCLTYGSINDTNYSVEQRLPGTNIKDSDINNSKNRQRVIDYTLQTITDLQLKSVNQTLLNDSEYKRLVSEPINIAKSLFSKDQHYAFETFTDYLYKNLYNKELPLVITHGDFSIDNVIFNGGEISGIIDWDYSMPKGFPLMDVLFFISSSYKRDNKYGTKELLYNTATQDGFNMNELNSVDLYCQTLNVDKSLIKSLGLIYVIYFIAYRLELNEQYDFYGFQKNFFGDLLSSLESFVKS